MKLRTFITLGAAVAIIRAATKHLNKDRKALASMLIAETGGRGDVEELQAIAQVAVNRAERDGSSVTDVVTPPGKSSNGVWNTSQQFKRDFDQAPNHRNFARALEIAEAVLSQNYENQIGTRRQFVHAANFNRCSGQGPCDSGRASQVGRRSWQCIQTQSGRRCVPSWAAVDPVNVGRATFSTP